MTWAWSIVITGVLEHCDDKVSWSLAMTKPWNIVMAGVMEHCYHSGNGAL